MVVFTIAYMIVVSLFTVLFISLSHGANRGLVIRQRTVRKNPGCFYFADSDVSDGGGVTLRRWPSSKPALGQLQLTRRWTSVGLPLVHRLRRWTNSKPTLIQRLVSAICWDISCLQGRSMHCVKCTEHCVPDNNLFVCLCPSYSLSPADKSATPCLPHPPGQMYWLLRWVDRHCV